MKGAILAVSATFKITNINEKLCLSDVQTKLAIIDRYILILESFDVLKNTSSEKNGGIKFKDALIALTKKIKVLDYKFQSKRFDYGCVEDCFVGNQSLYTILN